jgi:formylglycine-generating enzyme required for sulfatase activity
MAYIPGGEFVFGATKKEQAKVTVQPFCIDVSETTADAYDACVKAGKCDATRLGVCDPSTYGKEGRGKMPMVCVDFPQAEKYCAAQDKRLLTAEEWEWAARGASATSNHPWGEGEVDDQVCWSGKSARSVPCDVGSFPKGDSPQGVHDLLGGVREWTTTKTDGVSSNRYARGGSWTDNNKALFDVSHHGIFKASYRCGFVGIRCAKAAAP